MLYISFAMLAIELVGWSYSNSLALLGDSGHVAADAFAVGVALTVSVRARKQTLKKARKTRTAGFAVQILLLAIVATWLFVEGISRLFAPPEIASLPLIIAAVLGALGNIGQLGVLEGGFRNLTAHGVRTHLFADFLQSLGVIVSGIVVWATAWHAVDPLVSLGIALYIAYQVHWLFSLAAHDAKRNREQSHQ